VVEHIMYFCGLPVKVGGGCSSLQKHLEILGRHEGDGARGGGHGTNCTPILATESRGVSGWLIRSAHAGAKDVRRF